MVNSFPRRSDESKIKGHQGIDWSQFNANKVMRESLLARRRIYIVSGPPSDSYVYMNKREHKLELGS